MSIGTKIVLALILIHLILGFGWLFYQLSPREKSSDKKESDDADE